LANGEYQQYLIRLLAVNQQFEYLGFVVLNI